MWIRFYDSLQKIYYSPIGGKNVQIVTLGANNALATPQKNKCDFAII